MVSGVWAIKSEWSIWIWHHSPPLLFVTCADHQQNSYIVAANLTFSSPPSPLRDLMHGLQGVTIPVVQKPPLQWRLQGNVWVHLEVVPSSINCWVWAPTNFDVQEVNYSLQDLTQSFLSVFSVSWLKFQQRTTSAEWHSWMKRLVANIKRNVLKLKTIGALRQQTWTLWELSEFT